MKPLTSVQKQVLLFIYKHRHAAFFGGKKKTEFRIVTTFGTGVACIHGQSSIPYFLKSRGLIVYTGLSNIYKLSAEGVMAVERMRKGKEKI
jgi:hypothetical protein